LTPPVTPTIPDPATRAAPRPRRPVLATETLVLAVCAFAVLALNGSFWHGALDARDPFAPATWAFAAGTLTLLVTLHFALLAPLATRLTVRPLLTLVLVAGALAAYYMDRYGVVLDPAMMRNVVHTDAPEALELAGPGVLWALAWVAVPIALLWWVEVRRRAAGAALLRRVAAIACALVVAAVSAFAVFKDFSSLMRNQRELRYAITPANVGYSLGRALASDARAAHTVRAPSDPAVRAPAARRPTLFVVVVGETVRAANFGLSGYARNTTPELAARGVVAFPRVEACGTSTEVSVPCMFSPFGRADYDEARIRSHDSLPQVLAHAGLRVLWRDNQSGCKGVCDGVETHDLSSASVPGLCADGRCLDEVLLHGLDAIVAAQAGDMVVFMHQLGNHGPAYFRRYPPAFARWQPACDKAELRDCTRGEIVNAYDNAVAYTDHFLARVIDFLDAQRGRFDVGMVYVSDHGESLGEYGLYLHGMPQRIAPREQREVPMVWWMPADAARGLRVDIDCLQRRAQQPASHDNLYHSVIGLLDVMTPRYRGERDLFGGCRSTDIAAAERR
jgi:lipid A ethanolaminephosphotransferase